MRRVAVYAGTRNLYKEMRTAVVSLLTNNQMDRVYLLIEDDAFPYEMPENVLAVNVSKQKFFPEDGPNYKSKWTYMAMIRIALSKMFPREKRMLWLDCDTIVDADISELFDMDMDENYFAGVKEHRKSRDGKSYINTGVLLMNLEQIRWDRLDDKLISVLNSKKLELPDQDAINMLARGRIIFIDSKYNVCPFTRPPEEMKIYHFAAREIFDNDPLYKKYSLDKTGPTRILIAVPCFDMVNTDFMKSLLDLEKTEGTSYTVIKNSLIYNARNLIAQNAIRHGFDRVLWLDSDIVCEPDALIRLSEDLDNGYDFVSGLYFMRSMPTKPVIYSEIIYEVRENEATTGAKNVLDYPKDSLFSVAGAGFGCVMTSVVLLKKLVEKFGAPFTPMMGLGEDLAFCYRAKKVGAKLYCDSRVKCGHIGTVTINESFYDRGALNEEMV